MYSQMCARVNLLAECAIIKMLLMNDTVRDALDNLGEDGNLKGNVVSIIGDMLSVGVGVYPYPSCIGFIEFTLIKIQDTLRKIVSAAREDDINCLKHVPALLEACTQVDRAYHLSITADQAKPNAHGSMTPPLFYLPDLP